MISHPALRPGVSFDIAENGIRFAYLRDEFVLALDDPSVGADVVRVLRALDGSTARNGLRALGAARVDVDLLLDLLEQQNYLEEGRAERLAGISGAQFARLLEARFAYDWFPAKGKSVLSERVLAGTATTQSVIGWAVELYHVTVRAHDALAPAAGRAHGVLKRRLEQYFREEYRHDKLMRVSLRGLDFTDDQISAIQPLPGTASLMNALSRWARTDVLSFIAALFLFEGTSTQGNRYLDALRLYPLPNAFVDGQARHNQINADEGHGDVTVQMFAMVPFVSDADAERVMANVVRTLDLIIAMQEDVIRYYDDRAGELLRRLSAPLVSAAVQSDAVRVADVIHLVRAEIPGAELASDGIASWQQLDDALTRLFGDVKTALITAVRQQVDLQRDERFSQAFIYMENACADVPPMPLDGAEARACQSLGDCLVVLADDDPYVFEIALATALELLGVNRRHEAPWSNPACAVIGVAQRFSLEAAVERFNAYHRPDPGTRRRALALVGTVVDLTRRLIAAVKAASRTTDEHAAVTAS